MALYYFHHLNGHLALDDQGTELPDAGAVRNEAVRAMRELLQLGPPERVSQTEPWKVWVTDQPDGRGKKIVTFILTVEMAI
jgi:hypothetical protein